MAEKETPKKVNLSKIAVGRKDLYSLDPKDIHIDPEWNERDLSRPNVKEHIEALAISISKIGVLQPLTAITRGDKVFLTDGFCRLAAVNIAIKKHGADIKGVPVRVEERGTNEADHTLSMLTRNEGLAFTFAEQARVVKRLIDFGWSKKEIAEKSCRSLTHIDNCVMLLESDPKGEVMKLIDSGKVSVRLALETIRESKAKGQVNEAPEKIKKAVTTALEKGKAKATKRTAKKPTSTDKTEKKISWGKHGPEFMKLLEALETAFEDSKTSNKLAESVGDIVTYYKDYKHDNKLEPIKEVKENL